MNLGMFKDNVYGKKLEATHTSIVREGGATKNPDKKATIYYSAHQPLSDRIQKRNTKRSIN